MSGWGRSGSISARIAVRRDQAGAAVAERLAGPPRAQPSTTRSVGRRPGRTGAARRPTGRRSARRRRARSAAAAATRAPSPRRGRGRRAGAPRPSAPRPVPGTGRASDQDGVRDRPGRLGDVAEDRDRSGRRARRSMRSCIGVRSCASSTIRWPRGAVGPVEERARLVQQRQVGLAPALAAAGQEEALLVRVEDAVGRGGERLRAASAAGGRAARASAAARGRPASGSGNRRSAAPPRCRRRSSRPRLPRRGRVPVVERAHELHPQALAAGGVVGRLRLRLADERGDLLGRQPQLRRPRGERRAAPPGGCGSARTAAAITSASRASPFRRATSGSSRRDRLDPVDELVRPPAARRAPRRASAARARCSP